MYPSIEEVEAADQKQLANWYRFLSSPGSRAVGEPDFESVLQREKIVMDRICERFAEMGGMNPAISKTIGW